MKTTVITIRFYPSKYWFFRWYKFQHIDGFKIRFFGVEIIRMETNATNKLINLFRVL